MNPRGTPRGRLPAFASVVLVSLATLIALAGCSSGPQELLGPSASSAELAATSEPSRVVAALLPPLDLSKYPRIRVWTEDGWRQYQREGGVSLAPSRIFQLELPELQPVTFHWSALPQGQSLGTRWAVDMVDILDNAPRSGPGDFAHWSSWSATETSATAGPFITGPDSTAFHFFYLEARDNNGFVSLLTVRMRVFPASAGVAEVLRVKRR